MSGPSEDTREGKPHDIEVPTQARETWLCWGFESSGEDLFQASSLAEELLRTAVLGVPVAWAIALSLTLGAGTLACVIIAFRPSVSVD